MNFIWHLVFTPCFEVVFPVHSLPPFQQRESATVYVEGRPNWFQTLW